MNYIRQLQIDLAGQIAHRESLLASLRQFRVFLNSDKFTGTQYDGERKDWIATGDVIAWTQGVESLAQSAEDHARVECREMLQRKVEMAAA